jgi:hypothetical protein
VPTSPTIAELISAEIAPLEVNIANEDRTPKSIGESPIGASRTQLAATPKANKKAAASANTLFIVKVYKVYSLNVGHSQIILKKTPKHVRLKSSNTRCTLLISS